MNASLTGFEPAEKASKQWALNDAVKSYRTLATDYTYAQCWDPKGWSWHPADGAEQKAKKYDYLD
jgi:hypothetical protein